MIVTTFTKYYRSSSVLLEVLFVIFRKCERQNISTSLKDLTAYCHNIEIFRIVCHNAYCHNFEFFQKLAIMHIAIICYFSKNFAIIILPYFLWLKLLIAIISNYGIKKSFMA